MSCKFAKASPRLRLEVEDEDIVGMLLMLLQSLEAAVAESPNGRCFALLTRDLTLTFTVLSRGLGLVWCLSFTGTSPVHTCDIFFNLLWALFRWHHYTSHEFSAYPNMSRKLNALEQKLHQAALAAGDKVRLFVNTIHAPSCLWRILAHQNTVT